jgi:Glycosyl transferase family 2
MSTPRSLSVIVPARDNSASLPRVLTAILGSELPRDDYELIVVDDASTDGSPEISARYADTVIRLSGRRSGPAYARNRGAELAQGEILAFVDADVVVQRDTLPRMLALLSKHPGLDAISCSHSRTCAPRNVVSQYWNLLLHFGEQRHSGTSGNVASPCAAIRSTAFFAAGMFDEWRFEDAPLEGLEFGRRLEESGRDVLSCRDLEITGLRHWDIRSVCREAWRRSVLLARSLGYQRTRRAVPSEIVFTLSRTAAPVLALLSVIAFSAAFLPRPDLRFAGVMLLLGALAVNLPAQWYFARERGFLFSVGITPLHFLAQAISGLGLCAGWVLRHAVGDDAPDAATQAYAEVGVETWPPVPRISGEWPSFTSRPSGKA